MYRFNAKERRMVMRAFELEMTKLLKKRGLTRCEASEEELAAIHSEALDRAEASFWNEIDRQIDEAKERKTFGDDE